MIEIGVTEIGVHNKAFNLREAKELLPLIQSITKQYRQSLEPIQDRLNKMLSNDPRRSNVEHEYELIVCQWKSKVEQLGVYVKGLWIAEFMVSMGRPGLEKKGYLSWKFPEKTVQYYRVEGQSFSDRVRLSEYIAHNDPDWARS